jgi:predicted CXXCH cytochrome family protein
VNFHDPGDGSVPQGLVDPANPGHGLCEICHKTTQFYRANGKGESHFTGDCMLCHDHTAGFQPVVSDANCTICHPSEASLLAKSSLHHDRFTGTCSSCHAEVSPEPGPGHRAKSACVDCHSQAKVATHVPPGITIPCTQCHEPHGTDNIRLIRDVIQTIEDGARPIQFANFTGKADGSFASASAPGTGLCEVCHTQTRFYRADGSGSPHYTTTCLQCHPHDAGFAPH